jgi:serine/threonine protein kinase
MKGLLGAVNYTHSLGIAHRDLKPENILIKKSNGKFRLKIIDWGLGTLMGAGRSSNRVCGTPEYAAPEVFKGNYTVACDMWSLGSLTYVILTG